MSNIVKYSLPLQGTVCREHNLSGYEGLTDLNSICAEYCSDIIPVAKAATEFSFIKDEFIYITNSDKLFSVSLFVDDEGLTTFEVYEEETDGDNNSSRLPDIQSCLDWIRETSA